MNAPYNLFYTLSISSDYYSNFGGLIMEIK